MAERAPGGSDYYYFQDALGSVMAMTDPSGAVANSYKYDPYGDIVSQTETTPYVNLFRFAGGLYTSSLGLHKFGMRWYDQKLGRWTQQDPIDQAGDLTQANRYQYAGDNPINNVDPRGLFLKKFFRSARKISFKTYADVAISSASCAATPETFGAAGAICAAGLASSTVSLQHDLRK